MTLDDSCSPAPASLYPSLCPRACCLWLQPLQPPVESPPRSFPPWPSWPLGRTESGPRRLVSLLQVALTHPLLTVRQPRGSLCLSLRPCPLPPKHTWGPSACSFGASQPLCVAAPQPYSERPLLERAPHKAASPPSVSLWEVPLQRALPSSGTLLGDETLGLPAPCRWWRWRGSGTCLQGVRLSSNGSGWWVLVGRPLEAPRQRRLLQRCQQEPARKGCPGWGASWAWGVGSKWELLSSRAGGWGTGLVSWWACGVAWRGGGVQRVRVRAGIPGGGRPCGRMRGALAAEAGAPGLERGRREQEEEEDLGREGAWEGRGGGKGRMGTVATVELSLTL